uniref:Retrotransposon gag domain-containing protein n=1 Tax=Cannabis sativa TaxID=3483 RepID=A0A803QGE1_CANSA
MIWTNLEERFNQKNAPRVFEGIRTKQSLAQGTSSVTNYFTRLKTLWDLIQEYRPQPTCTCGAMKTIQDYQEEDRVLEFLVGLNESYNAARSQFLIQDPLPNINRAYASIIQEERQRSLTNISQSLSSPSDADKSTVGQFAGSVWPFKPKMVCHHCGILGHIMSKCYRLHGYHPGHKLYGKFPNQNVESVGNSNVKLSTANVETKSEGNENSNGDAIKEDQDLVSSLSVMQCQRLMALLSQRTSYQSANPSKEAPLVSHFFGENLFLPKSKWIIDRYWCYVLYLF